MTQFDLSELCQLSQTSLSQIETGIKNPSPGTIKKVCEVLEIPESLIYIMAMNDKDVPKSKEYVYHLVFPMIRDLAWQMVFVKELAFLKQED